MAKPLSEINPSDACVPLRICRKYGPKCTLFMWMERCQSVMHPHLVMQAKPDHAQKICVLGMFAKFRKISNEICR